MRYQLTSDCLYQNGAAVRRRAEEQPLRDFLTQLTTEFYEGEDYRFGVVDDLGLACLAVTSACLKGETKWRLIPAQQRALVFATRSGSLMTDLEFQESLEVGGRTSPRVFVQTLPNMAAGQVSACFAVRGEHFVLIQSSPDDPASAETVDMCLTYGGAQACLTGWAEYSAEGLNVELSVVYAEANVQASAAEFLTNARS
jgi:hypothetical protein